MNRSFVEDVYLHLRAGYSILAVNTPEEVRCIDELTKAGWMMGEGRPVKLDADNHKKIKEVFDNAVTISGAGPRTWGALKPDKILTDGTLAINVEYLAQCYDSLIRQGDKRAEFIKGILDQAGYPVVTWDLITGFPDNSSQLSLEEVLVRVAQPYEKDKDNVLPQKCIVVIKDCHQLINHADMHNYRRMLRNMYEENTIVNPMIRRHVVFLQPDWTPVSDIAHCVAFIDFAPPDEHQLDQEISFTELSLSNKKLPTAKCPPEIRRLLVQSLRGLTQGEASNALALAVAARNGFVPEMIPDIHRTKAQMLKSDEVLEYVDADHVAAAGEIGGYENYLDFVAECRECYTDEARAAGLKRPKGALLLGPPGTGKSLVAMATAKMMQLPLIKFDFGSVFGGIVGQSEATMRRSLKRIKALGPCVLMIDEADKAFAGMNQTSGDSGVGQRVFGRLLTWTALENEDAFLIMTMNRLDGVPVEMLRSGRLDATFYTELPDPGTREEILKIHMAKNKINVKLISSDAWETLIADTEDYVGSELEQIAIRAARISWKARKTIAPTAEELIAAQASVNPVTKLDAENVKKILDFCKDRATNVSRPKQRLNMSTSRRKRAIETAE